MTTFIFMLTKVASQAMVERAVTDLATAFPQHEFLAGDADIGGYENNILAMHGSVGDVDDRGSVVLPKTQDVEDVQALFAKIVRDLEGWKPS